MVEIFVLIKQVPSTHNLEIDKKTGALTLAEKKDTDLTVANVLKNTKSKPKKRAKRKVDSSVKSKV